MTLSGCGLKVLRWCLVLPGAGCIEAFKVNRESEAIDACMGVGALVGTEKETAVHCPFYWRGAGGPMRWCYSNVISAQCCYHHEQAEQLWWSCQSSLGLNACRSTGPGKCFIELAVRHCSHFGLHVISQSLQEVSHRCFSSTVTILCNNIGRGY